MVSQRLLSATSKAKLPKLVMVSMGIPKIHYFRFVNHQELCFCLPKMTAFCLPLLVVCLSSFLLAFYLASLLSLLLPFAASAAVGGTSNGPNGMQRHDLRKAGATARIFRHFAQDCILKDLKMDPAGRTLSCGSTLLTIY